MLRQESNFAEFFDRYGFVLDVTEVGGSHRKSVGVGPNPRTLGTCTAPRLTEIVVSILLLPRSLSHQSPSRAADES
jgi:hypothetical protein